MKIKEIRFKKYNVILRKNINNIYELNICGIPSGIIKYIYDENEFVFVPNKKELYFYSEYLSTIKKSLDILNKLVDKNI